jgi:hypothetical protein
VVNYRLKQGLQPKPVPCPVPLIVSRWTVAKVAGDLFLLSKKIPITGGDEFFVTGGDLFPGAPIRVPFPTARSPARSATNAFRGRAQSKVPLFPFSHKIAIQTRSVFYRPTAILRSPVGDGWSAPFDELADRCESSASRLLASAS